MFSSNRKGAVAEAEIAAAAIRRGISVLKPVTEHGRYDLVFDIGGRLLRVQCKWAALAADGSVVAIRVGGCRSTPRGYVRSSYSAREIDLLAAYCADLDRCYLLPASLVAGLREIRLRLDPPRNCQRACINLAGDYDFAGAVAQLGERVTGSHEATGSSPVSSISPEFAVRELGAHEFRERFGFYMECAAAGEELLIRRHGRPFARLLPALPP